jgi:hypothetical protein
MIGADVLAGAAVSHLLRKAGRAANKADQAGHEDLGAGTDQICALVNEFVGSDPALTLLDQQARVGTVSDRTERRAKDAIAEAVEADAGFAQRLAALVHEMEISPGVVSVSGAASTGAGRDVNIRAESGGIAAGVVGPVTLNPLRPDPVLA